MEAQNRCLLQPLNLLGLLLLLVNAARADVTCGVVREDWPVDKGVLDLSCTEPGSSIAALDFVSYGQPDCASADLEATTPEQPSCTTCHNKFKRTGCDTKNATAIVSSLCVNRASCKIPVKLALFGDPCEK